jgi:hypothetical protein
MVRTLTGLFTVTQRVAMHTTVGVSTTVTYLHG